ncbi:DUF4835 family protein [Urechidicola vernalis]|uniref:DUF4835 family protein n=1 Tax=Urechidicola vernalis TaxID=3075600 RepID=A0ABU2Y6X5_9FLAO|nr:DUF4835 family protein [Urechidicola sp. P050]MDT0553959.1 DUF4835 family protein [Urechidicola sp. P050]
MVKFIKLCIVLLIAFQANAQEIRATFEINTDNVPGSNKQVFTTMERSLSEFVNQKKWTNKKFKQQEKIDCAFILTITSQPSSNEFQGTLQVQSSRPVYGSSYQTPVLNFKDNDFSFRYTEFENFQYNPNGFDSNLVSIMAYYVYLILGMDGDTFAMNGGTEYYDAAENVVNQAQQSGYTGWSRKTSGINRFNLITDILSGTYDGYRSALYIYHLNGLDLMHSNQANAKANIEEAIQSIKGVYTRRANAILIRFFMDAKSDEIVEIYSDGARYDTSQLKDDLTRISPSNLSKWNSIN